MNASGFAAIVFALFAGGVVVFQLALALGAPWGEYAMGGSFPGRYPPAMRVAAVAQAMLVAAMAVLMLSVAGLVLPAWAQAPRWLSWAVVVFSAISVVLNLMTPSAGERRIWVPVALVMLGSSLAVVLSTA